MNNIESTITLESVYSMADRETAVFKCLNVQQYFQKPHALGLHLDRKPCTLILIKVHPNSDMQMLS